MRILYRTICKGLGLFWFQSLRGICAPSILPASPQERIPLNNSVAIALYATQEKYICSILINIYLLQHVVQSKTRITVTASPGLSSAAGQSKWYTNKRIRLIQEWKLSHVGHGR